MKFECSAEQLLTAAGTAVRFVERRPNLPVLAGILVSVEGGRVLLRATNLECGVETTTPAKVGQAGVVVVPGSVLYGFLSTARGKNISAVLQKEVLKLETERASASIKTISHDDFPNLPRVPATHSFAVKASDLVKAIRGVVYCASTSAVKPEQQSVLICAEAGKLTAAATDSFRLAEKSVPLRAGGSVPQLLLPARNAAELVRILESAGGDVELYYSENQISTHAGDVYYTSRLLDGAFPNYRQIVPKSFSTEAVLLREDFSQALKSLSIFADKFAQVTLEIAPGKKAALFTSRNPDVGESTSTVRATCTGEAVVLNFNGRYLADSLQSINGESVRLCSNGAGKAMLIKDAGDESFFYLAMPMNR